MQICTLKSVFRSADLHPKKITTNFLVALAAYFWGVQKAGCSSGLCRAWVERLVLDEFFELHLEPRYSLDIEINADLSQWGRRS